MLLSQNKPVSQSSDYSPLLGKAEEAVDGDTNQKWEGGSCMATSDSTKAPVAWWQVDLGVQYRIGNITIWNRIATNDICNVL